MYKGLTYGLIICALLGGLLYSLNETLKIPDVKFSYSTNECVEVVNYDSDHTYDCGNYPNKFNHVWVE
jgi:hypothetical protein